MPDSNEAASTPPPEQPSPLPETAPVAESDPPGRRRVAIYALIAGIGAVVVLGIAIGAVALGRSDSQAGGKYSAAGEPLRVFASVAPHAEILRYVGEKLATDGFRLKIIEETDNVDGNDVVEHGDADANFFQHVPYLNASTKDKGYTDLVVAATVHVEPYGIYSSQYKKLEDLPHHALVLLSNNVSNFARGLYLLQAAGLIKLDHQQGDTSPSALAITEKNIVENPKHLVFKQVDPPQIPRSLPDAAIGLINGNVALESGLKPAKDALLLESPVNNPYANILVVPKALKNDPRVRQLSKHLEGPQVADFINDRYPGSVLPVNKGSK